jgi:glucose-6-phosphate 1-dehydrogenase
MSKRIHIEDTLFFLQSRIKLLSDGLVLTLEPDLFLESYLQDLDHLQACIGGCIHAIQENDKYIDWEEQVKNLIDLEDTYAALIEDLMQGKGTLGAAFIPISEKLDQYKTLSKERRKQLEQLLSLHPDEQDNGMVVSPQELRELLQD